MTGRKFDLFSGILIIVVTFVLLCSQAVHGSSNRKWKKPSADVPISQGATPEDILKRGTLRVGLEPGFMPFELKTKTGALVGFDIDLANEIASAMNVKLEVHELEWGTLIPDLLDTKIDLILIGMTVTEERKKTINFA